jgi:hypothetical protein
MNPRTLTAPVAALAMLWLPAPPPLAQPAPTENALRLSLGYDGRLLLKVLDVQVEERISAGRFDASAELVSAGILRALKHIHQVASAEGRIVVGRARPAEFQTQKLTGKTRRKVRTVWLAGDVPTTAEPAFANLGDPPAALAQKLASIDPLTALVEITTAGSREKTCSRTYQLFDGKQLYALDFGQAEDAPPSDKERRLGLTGHFRCDVRFRELAGFSKKPPNKRNQGLDRPVKLDFARVGSDGPWVISALHAQTPLGWASIELSRLTVTGRLRQG